MLVGVAADREATGQRLAYGPAPDQFGVLHVPAGTGPWPVVVILHGGFWRARYDHSLGTPLALDLAAHGFAAWNVEYRRVGNGGGWPITALDVAAAVDLLARLTPSPAHLDGNAAASLDLSRVVALGHSAGGHLAAWLGGRARLGAPFPPPVVAVTGVVSQAGVLDLEAAVDDRLGDGATVAFLGAPRVSGWQEAASPIRLLPFGVPIRCVHGDRDDTVPIAQSSRFVAAARHAGDDAELIVVPGGDHFGVITPGDPAWDACRQAVRDLASSA
jgi:acetyl esterase/lipase